VFIADARLDSDWVRHGLLLPLDENIFISKPGNKLPLILAILKEPKHPENKINMNHPVVPAQSIPIRLLELAVSHLSCLFSEPIVACERFICGCIIQDCALGNRVSSERI